MHELPPRPLRVAAITAAVMFTAMGFVTTALTAVILRHDPLLLIALEAPWRNMFLASQAPAVPFVLIAALRRTASATVYFYLGRWYGEEFVRKLESRNRTGGTIVRAVERAVRVAAYPMVFFFPVPLVGALAGSIRLPPALFVATSFVGSATIAIFVKIVGHALEAPIQKVLVFLDKNVVWVTAFIVATIAVSMLWKWHRTRRKIEHMAEEERVLEEAADGAEAAPGKTA